MEWLDSLWDAATRPFAAQDRLFWLYALSSLGIAVAAYGARGRWEELRAIVSSWLDRRAVGLDVSYMLVNAIVVVFCVSPLVLGSRTASSATRDLLAGVFGPGPGWEAGAFSTAGLTLCVAIAWDGAQYGIHRLHHALQPLWEIHKVHHSARVLAPFTAFRFHPVELFLSSSAAGLVMGAVHGLFRHLHATKVAEIELMGLNAVFFLFFLAGANLRHSSVWVTYPPALSRIFVSPAMHQIHHSVDPRHRGRNLGVIFSFWDRLFGTLYVPEGEERLRFGLPEGEDDAFDGLVALYLRPLRRVAGEVSRRRGAGRSRSCPPARGAEPPAQPALEASVPR